MLSPYKMILVFLFNFYSLSCLAEGLSVHLEDNSTASIFSNISALAKISEKMGFVTDISTGGASSVVPFYYSAMASGSIRELYRSQKIAEGASSEVFDWFDRYFLAYNLKALTGLIYDFDAPYRQSYDYLKRVAPTWKNPEDVEASLEVVEQKFKKFLEKHRPQNDIEMSDLFDPQFLLFLRNNRASDSKKMQHMVRMFDKDFSIASLESDDWIRPALFNFEWKENWTQVLGDFFHGQFMEQDFKVKLSEIASSCVEKTSGLNWLEILSKHSEECGQPYLALFWEYFSTYDFEQLDGSYIEETVGKDIKVNLGFAYFSLPYDQDLGYQLRRKSAGFINGFEILDAFKPTMYNVSLGNIGGLSISELQDKHYVCDEDSFVCRRDRFELRKKKNWEFFPYAGRVFFESPDNERENGFLGRDVYLVGVKWREALLYTSPRMGENPVVSIKDGVGASLGSWNNPEGLSYDLLPEITSVLVKQERAFTQPAQVPNIMTLLGYQGQEYSSGSKPFTTTFMPSEWQNSYGLNPIYYENKGREGRPQTISLAQHFDTIICLPYSDSNSPERFVETWNDDMLNIVRGNFASKKLVFQPFGTEVEINKFATIDCGGVK